MNKKNIKGKPKKVIDSFKNISKKKGTEKWRKSKTKK